MDGLYSASAVPHKVGGALAVGASPGPNASSELAQNGAPQLIMEVGGYYCFLKQDAGEG